ncbi:hypothetical protein Tco_0984353 [Tanacetum coccineum]
MESLIADENAMDLGVADLIKHKKIPHDDDDRDQDPPAGPDQGLKKRKISKDAEPPKNLKSTSPSKSNTSSQPKSTGKFIQAEETVFEAADTNLPFNQGDDMGNTDEQPNVEAAPKANWVSKHDVYSTMRILSVTNVTVDEWYGYGHLKEIVVRRADQKLYKFMEVMGLRMYTRTIVILARVKYLQLGVESYQKKLNISKPRTCDVDLSCRALYTTLSESQGVIYEDKLKKKRLMCTEDLYKFNDGTLTLVRNTLDQMMKNLKLGYNKAMERSKWTTTYLKRSRIMIKDINQQLLNRRIMRSLEKFVGGRDYGTDYRLL